MMPTSTEQQTYSILTPPGRGAVAVIRLNGNELIDVLSKLFQSASGKRLATLTQRKQKNQAIFYGLWRSTGEDVVLVRIAESCWEVHCHGGQAASNAIAHSLIALGFEQQTESETAQSLIPLTEDAEPNLTVWQAETLLALAQATTETTAKIMLQQFTIAVDRWKSLNQKLKMNRTAALTEIENMLALTYLGQQLTAPRSVVLCGQPNVGKSSLVNAIVGFQRAIVHETPGTTRDVVTQSTAINGWPIELKDTAGLRTSGNEIEQQGIALSLKEIQSADCVIAVFAANEFSISSARKFASEINADLIVVNKCDLVNTQQRQQLLTAVNEADMLEANKDTKAKTFSVWLTSTTQRTGLGELIDAIGSHLKPAAIATDLLIPLSPVHEKQLLELRAKLLAGNSAS